MLRVALTGGIATGKTFCDRHLVAAGVPLIDADALARDAVAPGSPGLASIVKRFGPGLVSSDGTLDRQALASIVFSDRRARADLEAVIHPEVYRRIGQWFASLPSSTPFAVADIPLLFETGHEHDFDRVIVVACAPAEQLRRLMSRDGLSKQAALARIAAQWPIDDKASRAHHVIRTDGTFAQTEQQLRAIVDLIEADS